VKLEMDFNNDIFDFSKESDLKARLWEQMLDRVNERAPLREEIDLESISPQAQVCAPEENDMPPQNKRERTL
jgi:hypothetical protein